MSSRTASMILILAAASVAGCGRAERTETADTTSVSTPDRGAQEGNMERRLADLGARIDSLGLRVDAAGSNAKAGLRRELDSLVVKREEAQRKLADLRVAADARWDSLRSDMAGTLDTLDVRLERSWNALRGR